MRYPVQHIAEIMGGNFLAPPADAVIEHLLLDSRQVIFPASSLFIALQGRRYDGHEFLQELYDSGVRNFVVSKKLRATQDFPQANFILVENTLEAFHALAAWHRRQFKLPVIGITGSNGKTIVKEWLFQLLYEDFHIVRSPKSYNSQTGVPLSVLQITPEHTLGIFEAGISQPGEMAKLERILAPTIGIFTNIGEAHQEGFPVPIAIGIETKIREKLILFKNCETLIYCVDNQLVADTVRQLAPPLVGSNCQSGLKAKSSAGFGGNGLKYITWSATGKPADIQIIAKRQTDTSTKLEAKLHHQSSIVNRQSSIVIPFTDAASIENACHCWALLLSNTDCQSVLPGLPNSSLTPPGTDWQSVLQARMARLEPVAMRLELKEGLNGCTIINDSYNSDLTSLGIALNFLEQQSPSRTLGGKKLRRTLVLSDILQSGQTVEELYGTVAKLLVEKRIDRLIGIGGQVGQVKKELPVGFDARFYPTTQAFLDDFQQLTFRDEVVLLKGARQFEFERIANQLAIKFHKTVLEVNLGALLNNLRVYQSQLGPGTKMMVMVKAGAYGSGSTEVAKLLEFQNVDYLGVAYADEGVALRKAGIQLPIMVMNPEEATFEALVRYRLEPEVYSLGLLRNFQGFLENHFHQKSEKEIAPAQPIHLKFDTGMHRLGFEEQDLEALLKLLKPSSDAPFFTVKTIFSHLAASEAPAHDEFTREQFARFKKMYDHLAEGLGYQPMRHILNSGGIVRFPEQQLEMVRLGIGLYGVDSSGLLQDRLQTVNTLKATISQIKTVAVGETVGYGRLGKAQRPMRIATLSLGYADGLLRRAGNGQFSVLINGHRAPIIGNVCMDMTMADVTDIPDAVEGDASVIFGKELPVQELAASLGTIPYEIFTTISERVKRVYVQE
ncbi:MAG: bifunctional UDP-N-acetylmuramoyl-tripeptide:D-alanyl-D-alanine ligase/alanine racemase [Bacteroidales bacterium]|nr:bifunctional UDP-N-acetylmuramoyl-tripeptide:D-alanyl-D-alanine ligase/alanine racemase [Bacteroidales bacterium]